LILLKLAVSYLRQAKARIDDAKDASKAENFPYAVRLSKECVELSIKAALRAVGIEYPKQHEVSDLLEETKKRYPPWFAQEIPFIQET
jgi:HEPN domain-containing protein